MIAIVQEPRAATSERKIQKHHFFSPTTSLPLKNLQVHTAVIFYSTKWNKNIRANSSLIIPQSTPR